MDIECKWPMVNNISQTQFAGRNYTFLQKLRVQSFTIHVGSLTKIMLTILHVAIKFAN